MIEPRNTEDTAAWLRNQHKIGSREWASLCLSAQRQARGLPAVYPSANAAAYATPEEERIYKVKDLRRGMVAYMDNKHDSRPFGHVFFIAGRNKNNELMTWSTDAKVRGGIDMVPITFFKTNWNYEFMFGATWLNGYNFDEFDKPVAPPHRTRLGDNYIHAIEDVEKAIFYHKKKRHTRLVELLEVDLQRMKENLAKYSG